MTAPDEEDGEDDLRSVPLTDLFLALGTSFLIALFLAHPALRLAPAAQPDPAAALLAGRTGTGSDRPLLLLAGPKGVREGDGAGISLDALAGNGAALLAARLGAARDRPGGVLVVVLPGGDEAAFLLDPILAGAGIEEVSQIRLDPACFALRVPGEAARLRCARTLDEASWR